MKNMILVASLAAMIGTIVPAFAVDLTLDLKKPMMTADNKPFTQCDEWANSDPPKCLKTSQMLFANAILQALSAPSQALSADERPKAGEIGIRIGAAFGAGKITLTPAEITILQKQISNVVANPVLAARMCEVIGGCSK